MSKTRSRGFESSLPRVERSGLSNSMVSADGKGVYVASLLSDAVARFNRAP